MRIGFFDSGVGGATVLAKALGSMPEEDFLYYADTLHVPYGEKPKEEVRGHIFDAVAQMVDEGIKALVIACNTATSIAAKELRERYSFPIIGMEPAVKPAVMRTAGSEKRVLVFATSLTLKEAKFQQLVSAVDQRHIVDHLALPGLVELAERGIFSGPEAEGYLRRALAPFDLGRYGTAVLGCTHFPLFRPVFAELLPAGTDLIDGAEGTVRHLRATLEKAGLAGGGSGRLEFMSSGKSADTQAVFQAALHAAADMERQLRRP
ncbi:glutamate racemase [Paenibacillus sp. YN15]|uniref:glutamate racemase n=1 Tax=Paenibacillus sp. YN15 TaxID=1742774 RepID=UPI000DCEC5E2|nr:glutamate racemase [Paenibacillus sp. YN15]RAV05647.1 glutamate racemase [Paenibacillus sp. YN15]